MAGCLVRARVSEQAIAERGRDRERRVGVRERIVFSDTVPEI